LYQRITYEELAEQEIAYKLDPWDEQRADLRAGMIASATLAPHMKKGAKPPSPRSFVMGINGPNGREQTQEEMEAVARRINERHRKAREAKQRQEIKAAAQKVEERQAEG